MSKHSSYARDIAEAVQMMETETEFGGANSIETLHRLVTTIPRDHYRLVTLEDVNNPGTEIGYNLNEITIERIQNILNGEDDDITGSDNAFLQSFSTYGILRYEDIPQRLEFRDENDELIRLNQHPHGGLFMFWNKTKYDLSRFGIYKNFDSKNYRTNCLHDALKNSGLDTTRVNTIRAMTVTRHTPINSLTQIAEAVNITIRLRRERVENSNQKSRVINYGNGPEVYDICLASNHYFYYDEDTGIAVKDLDSTKPRSRTKMDSFKLVNYLLENVGSALEPFTLTERIKLQNICSSEVSPKDSNPTDFVRIIPKKSFSYDHFIIHGDSETFYNGQKEVAYLLCVIEPDGTQLSFKGPDCGLQVLKYYRNRRQNFTIYFHNAKFDLYACLLQYLIDVKLTTRGPSLISATAKFGDRVNMITIRILDTYKFLTARLSELGKMFKLEGCEKDAMPYNVVNEESLGQRLIDIKTAANSIVDGFTREQFYENVGRRSGVFDLWEYAEKYCFQDIKVQKTAFEKFVEIVKNELDLNVYEYVTISALAYDYAIQNRCLEGCHNVKGLTQKWLMQAVVGGRVMTRNNKKYNCNFDINALDANSLYPSAMVRMHGIPIGAAKVLETGSDLSKYDYYVVKIRITSVGRHSAFPIITYKNEKGCRVWTNDPCEMVVGRYYLEDLIEFQKIEYEVLEGFYWDEGFNTSLPKIIEHLYTQRMKYKNTNPAVSNVYKLILNSIYGKSLLKPIETEDKVYNSWDDFMKHLNRDGYKVEKYIKTHSKVFATEFKSVLEHLNCAIFGIMVLDMSKRIMNEMMFLAEDHGINIYYEDTDSSYIENSRIGELEEIYEAKYNRKLIGNGLGQFKRDLSTSSGSPAIAKKSIFLGKKSYWNEIHGITDNSIEDHARMKGVPPTTLQYEAKKDGWGLLEQYTLLYAGVTQSYDLLEGGLKFCPKYKDFSIIRPVDFHRVLQF